MCPGLTADLREVDDARKTAVIDKEITRLNRLADSGTIREANYTFFWKGKSLDEPRLHGVGFAVKKNTLIASIEPPSGGTERILVLRLSTSSVPVNIINTYAPTLCSTAEEKDQFYEALDEEVTRIPSIEGLYLLGDFNAMGADHVSWPTCLGIHGRGKINENGQRLLELCCFHGLCVTNTFFKCKGIHQVSWGHQLDLVITRRSDLASVLLTRSYHSADCDMIIP